MDNRFFTLRVAVALTFFGSVLGACSATPTRGGGGPGAGGAVGATMGVPASGPIIGAPLETFDLGLGGFDLNPFVEAGNLTIAATPATVTWNATDGSPDPGCVQITAPYSGGNQWVDLEAPSFPAPLPDWSGRTMHVRIKVEPASAFTGSARLYVKTGTAFVFYTTVFTPFPAGAGWQEFVLPLVSPAPVPPANPGADPTQIITYGIDPLTASAPLPTPTAVTFYVDSFSIE